MIQPIRPKVTWTIREIIDGLRAGETDDEIISAAITGLMLYQAILRSSTYPPITIGDRHEMEG